MSYHENHESLTGSLYIVAAPSGGGKTSLVKALVDGLDDIAISVSHTTRQQRPGEVDGTDYFFVNVAMFEQMIHEDAFIEHAQVFGAAYGTSRHQIEERLRQGIDVVLDIDWQGAQQIKHKFPQAVSIFIIPPSLDVLKQRLQNRQQDNDAVIETRMQRAQAELSHYAEFDYLIVNDAFTMALDELTELVKTHRLRMERQVVKQRKLLSFLLS